MDEKEREELEAKVRKDKAQLFVRRIALIITDIIIINATVFLSLIMRFDVNLDSIPTEYIDKFKLEIIPYTLVTLVIFWLFRMYHSLWQYASIAELYKIAEACIISELAHIILTSFSDLCCLEHATSQPLYSFWLPCA